jgi:hypothetical protein
LRSERFWKFAAVSAIVNFSAMVERADPFAPDPFDPAKGRGGNVTK